MNKHLENVRALAGKNAALLRSAQASDDALADASHAEIDRLGKALAAANPGKAITDPIAGAAYNRMVTQRAALLRRVGA
jgi:hypothetical protein